MNVPSFTQNRVAPPGTLIATLGGQPQVVTFALDALLARGEPINEVVVVHLSPAQPRMRRALDRLAAEFPRNIYLGRSCRYRTVPIRAQDRVVEDILDEPSARAVLATMHELVALLKQQGRTLHLCIAGGRRIMGLMAISAAMLHFGHEDRLWHVFSPDEFQERADEGAIMHARPEDGVRLIQVPLVPWGAYFPGLRALASLTPAEALQAQTRLMDAAERARCQAVISRLTERQVEVLRAFAAGGTPQPVADQLCISVKTVDSHKSVILAECRTAWGLPEDGPRLDYHFLRERFGPYFAELG